MGVTVPVPMDDDQRAQRPHDRDADAAWSVPGYLLAGMALYGGIGWLLDQWLGTGWIVLVGLLAGSALAVYVIWLRYGTR